MGSICPAMTLATQLWTVGHSLPAPIWPTALFLSPPPIFLFSVFLWFWGDETDSMHTLRPSPHFLVPLPFFPPLSPPNSFVWLPCYTWWVGTLPVPIDLLHLPHLFLSGECQNEQAKQGRGKGGQQQKFTLKLKFKRFVPSLITDQKASSFSHFL